MTGKPSAFEKRVKRQVTARSHGFFVVVSPGLEQACLRELETLVQGETPPGLVEGGIEFEGSVTDAYKANLHLRTASRIIMRIDRVKAPDFATLEKKMAEFPWELYLYKNAPVSVQVTVKKSRLYHSGAVAERFEGWIRQRLDTSGQSSPETPCAQMVFIRGINDRFTVSLDSSGDLLYMRGLKTTGGKAPLRETLAAGMLMMAGYDGTMPLLDPMSGSGSFSLEAALMARGIPPGWSRNFAFFSWPCFRQGAWEQLRREAWEGIKPVSDSQIIASDTDPDTCEKLKKAVHQSGLSSLVRVDQADFFRMRPPGPEAEKGLLMFNPPYGLRLGSPKDSKKLVQRIFKTLSARYSGWRVGLISPFDLKALSAGFPLQSTIIFHGGMNLFFVRGTVP